MTHTENLIANARAELELAIMFGYKARELELRRRIAEMQEKVEEENERKTQAS